MFFFAGCFRDIIPNEAARKNRKVFHDEKASLSCGSSCDHTPYFSLWSMDDVPNRTPTCHWTGAEQPLTGILKAGRREYGFLGRTEALPMRMKSVEVKACSTTYVMESPEVCLTMTFTSPLLLEDLRVLARPITYITLKAEGRHGRSLPECTAVLSADGGPVPGFPGTVSGRDREGCGPGLRSGHSRQRDSRAASNRSGDDVRIDWGRLYLAVEPAGSVAAGEKQDRVFIQAQIPLEEGREALFALAYDEIYALPYFGQNLTPYWKKERETLSGLLETAFAQYQELARRCEDFSNQLWQEAVHTGGERYAQLLLLAYRQVIGGHALCEDPEGRMLFVFQGMFLQWMRRHGGCQLSSIPLFLRYQPRLVFGMMRPLIRYAASDAWPFDFAPHDAGQFPLLNGQVYSSGTDPQDQMPVEECGNMLLMTAAATAASGDMSFVNESWELLTTWAGYLRQHGLDPENQLCTDDFAGHLAHNCNLSIKAILGVAAYGRLLHRRGEEAEGERWIEAARSMAREWVERAGNGDGTYRLAFDRPGTFSMKYNAVWDKLLGCAFFPRVSGTRS